MLSRWLRRLYGRWLCWWFVRRGGKVAGLIEYHPPSLADLYSQIFRVETPYRHGILFNIDALPTFDDYEARLRRVPGGVEIVAEFETECGPVYK